MLVLAVGLSLAVGTRPVPLAEVVHALTRPDPSSIAEAAVRSRIPTTIAGLLVGAALGMGGALMQGMARNPLADPGLLGVNSGASLFVVLGMAFFGLSAPLQFVWLALAGAAIAMLLGYGAATASPSGATPITLALAGASVTAIASSIISGILIVNTTTLNSFRYWQLGSLTAASPAALVQLSGFLAVGAVIALVAMPWLNALALGDDAARSLGVRVGMTRALSTLATVLLCGTAAALVGPIAFVGLAVPHAVRVLAGTDYRWIVPLSALGGAAFLLVCDVVGRLLTRPSTLEVGIVTAVAGAPVFIALLRWRRTVGV